MVAKASSHAVESLMNLMEEPAVDVRPLPLRGEWHCHDKLRLLRNAVMAEEYH